MAPETRLWRSVIGTAFLDYTNAKTKQDRLEILNFFESKDFELICSLLDSDPNQVKDNIYKLDNEKMKYD